VSSKLEEYLVTKEGAAQSQLETAIWLWVTEDDPISIHTLAGASNDILHALGSKIGQPSFHRKWLDAKPKRFQKWVSEAQNFFKHGFRDIQGKRLHYFPLQAEILMFDSVLCWKALFKKLPLPPMLQLFGAYFVINRADVLGLEMWPYLFESLDVEKLRRLNRIEFFKEGLQALADAGRFTPISGRFTGFGR
jgi:hypothetical protein